MKKSLLDRLLEYYIISFEQYLELKKPYDLTNFAEGHKFDDIDKATKLVKDVIDNKGKILIYGDYDADGVMGTSILVKMFQYLDVVVDYYIPSRYLDGYGINLEHAKEYVDANYELIITVDNGISAFEAINYLHEHNVKVLVLDHHTIQDEVPLAEAICHPTYSHFGEVASSGAFTAFIFSISLLGYTDKYLATLASISLISDMMPLLSYNRNLLKAVIKDYVKGEFKSIDLIADNEDFNESVIGMKIAPRINSIGRLIEDSSVNEIVKYFISEDDEFILNYFSRILEVNEIRKNLTKNAGQDLAFDSDKNCIVTLGEFKEGIIGLIANSIMSQYHVPTIVFCKSKDDEYKGSARAPEGFNIVDAFTSLSDLLITFGGHASAGGCSIRQENYDEFVARFSALADSTPLEKVKHKCIEIYLNELNEANYELINTFSPFGESWNVPLFKIKHIKASTLFYSRDGKHILTSIGFSLRLVGFNFSKEFMSSFEYVDLIGTVKKSSYKGKSYIEFNISEIEDSQN